MKINKTNVRKKIETSAKIAASFGIIMTLGVWAGSIVHMLKVYIEKYLQNKWIDI